MKPYISIICVLEGKYTTYFFDKKVGHCDHSALRTRVTRAKRKEGSKAAQAGKEKQEGLLPRGSTNEKALC